MITRLLVILLIFALAAAAVAQSPIPILEIEPDTAHVGDLVTVRIIVPDQEDDSNIVWPEIGEQLGEFTVLQVDTLVGKAAKDINGVAFEMTVAAYDTGSFSTGPLDFTIGDDPWTLPGDSVQIASVLADTSITLRPLKSQAELRMTLMDWLRYYGPWVGGVLLTALLAWLLWRWWIKRGKNRGDELNIIPELHPYDQAVAALADLKANNPLATGDIKSYVSSLVFITKRLLERDSGEPVLEMTSYEMKKWMKRRTISFDSRDLHQLLSASDSVKFARETLDHASLANLYLLAEGIISAYRPRLEPVGESKEQTGEPNVPAYEDSTSLIETSFDKNPRGGSTGKSSNLSAEPAEPSSWSISKPDPSQNSSDPSSDSSRFAPSVTKPSEQKSEGDS
ncbi:hypothetical protein BMS3Bbin04_02145 [bacterium BMS3Bbin04]|nr:hypothetical protein BMS3Bbin04_02145 [bacterium BMS3Bbin04]